MAGLRDYISDSISNSKARDPFKAPPPPMDKDLTEIVKYESGSLGINAEWVERLNNVREKLGEVHYEEISNIIKSAPAEIRNIFEIFGFCLSILSTDKDFVYNPERKGIELNIAEDAKDKDYWNTIHEFLHMIDFFANFVVGSGDLELPFSYKYIRQLERAAQKDFFGIFKKDIRIRDSMSIKGIYALREEVRTYVDQLAMERHCVAKTISDIIDGFTEGGVLHVGQGGRGSDYWIHKYIFTTEVFANIGAIEVTDSAGLTTIENLLQQIHFVYKMIRDDIIKKNKIER